MKVRLHTRFSLVIIVPPVLHIQLRIQRYLKDSLEDKQANLSDMQHKRDRLGNRRALRNKSNSIVLVFKDVNFQLLHPSSHRLPNIRFISWSIIGNSL